MNGSLLDRRWWGAALLACLTAALAALTLPVHLPERGGDADLSSELPAGATKPAHEDLDAFLTIRRWGASPEETRQAVVAMAEPTAPAEPSINPALEKMGFVGLIVTRHRSAVLLEAPNGVVARFAPGDTLPDGRTLVSVTDNSLTLRGADLHEEVLMLFPRTGMEASTGDDTGAPRSAR